MAHSLRKFLSNRGSALFMVISTMTALMITCMAMYFSIVSSHSTEFAVFNQKQSYSSAVSIADMVLASLRNQSISDPNSLLGKIQALPEGGSITTDGNGFAAFDPSATGTENPKLGAYMMTITRLANDGAKKNYDIAVTTSVNGVNETVHNFIEIDETTTGGSTGAPPGDSEIFSATGYVPNDAFLNGGYYLTDVFYDCEYTYMDIYTVGQNRIGHNLYTGGTFEMGSDAMTVVKAADGGAISSDDVNKIGPVVWAIRGDFIIRNNAPFEMRGGSKIYVGGDMVCKSGGFFQVNNTNYTGPEDVNKPISFYINGDLIVNGWLNLNDKIELYVNGNIICNGGGINGNPKIYGTPKMTYNAKPHDAMDDEIFAKAMNELDTHTATTSYYKWDVSGNYDSSTENVDIVINATGSAHDGVPAYQFTYTFAHPDSASADDLDADGDGSADDETKGCIAESFEIDSIKVYSGGGDDKIPEAIIIDTGEDPDNIVTIKANANCNDDGSTDGDPNDFDTFMWFPGDESAGNGGRNILVKGRGTVIIDIPDGVTYQDAHKQYLMHYGWWLLTGNYMIEKDGQLGYSSYTLGQSNNTSSKVIPYIHTDCTDGDSCSYSQADASTTCAGCGGTRQTITCSIHGDICTYCPACQETKKDKFESGAHGFCANHVDREAVDAYVNSLPDGSSTPSTGWDKGGFEDAKDNWLDSHGDIIYPTTNIFLVSCDESANMRFAEAADGGTVQKNAIFGYVYAPYMTFKGKSSESNAGYIKLCGGLTVSDYVIEGIDSYIACYPEKMPMDIMGASGGTPGALPSFSTKTWKIDLGGY